MLASCRAAETLRICRTDGGGSTELLLWHFNTCTTPTTSKSRSVRICLSPLQHQHDHCGVAVWGGWRFQQHVCIGRKMKESGVSAYFFFLVRNIIEVKTNRDENFSLPTILGIGIYSLGQRANFEELIQVAKLLDLQKRAALFILQVFRRAWCNSCPQKGSYKVFTNLLELFANPLFQPIWELPWAKVLTRPQAIRCVLLVITCWCW